MSILRRTHPLHPLALRHAWSVVALMLSLIGCSKPIPFQLADIDSGAPLEGVRIYRHSVSLFSLLPSKKSPVETDFTGIATVNVPPNPTNLTFLRQGYEPTAVGVFRQMPSAMAQRTDAACEPDPDSPWQRILCWDDLMPKIDVPVRMRPLTSGAIEVFVVDERGLPLKGCEVLGATFLYLPMPGAELEWGFPELQRAVTDASGRAEMKSWSGFRNRFTARAEGRDSVFADVCGAEDISIQLRLPTLVWKSQRLRVIDQKGRPVPDATVSYGEIRNGIPAGPHAFIATTDRDGFTPMLQLPNAESMLIKVTARGFVDRMTAPLWRSLDEGGTWRVIMERN